MHIESKIPLSLVYKYQIRVVWIICDHGQETNAIKESLLEVPIAYSSRGMQIAIPFTDGFSHVMPSGTAPVCSSAAQQPLFQRLMGSWAGDKRIRGGHRGTKRLCWQLTSNSSVLQPHFTDCIARLNKPNSISLWNQQQHLFAKQT